MVEFSKYIFRLFERFGYEFKCQLSEGKYLYKHQQQADYWIVSDGLGAMEQQYDLFTALTVKYKEQYPLADKNTSLLMLVDMESYKEPENGNLFVQMENDPLYFKKYILPYTHTDFEDLEGRLKAMEVESIEDIIMRNEVFEDLIQNKGYARLLYSIIHKLPFIPIITDGAKDLDNNLDISPDITPLANSLESFPEKEEQFDSFIENLIKLQEDEGN